MNLVLFGNQFSDVFMPIIFALILASISFTLFYIFKNSNEKLFSEFHTSQQIYEINKKTKKKNNSVKSVNNKELSTVAFEEPHHGTKHIEIINDSEILNDDMPKELNSVLQPRKPILKITNDTILITEEECEELLWNKIPKDEVEILRSRHSSVESGGFSKIGDNEMLVNSKLSKGKKKRLKAKHKADNLKNKNDIQLSNIAIVNITKETVDNEENDNKEATDSHSCHSCVCNFTNLEDKKDLEKTIMKLNEERYSIMQKLNEIPSMKADIIALTNDNELYIKKSDDLQRTCNAMKKELTLSVQKNASIEGQFIRYKTEKNQQLGYYENEMSKLTNKVNVLENDIQAKVGEHEHFKEDIDKLHHLVSQKDKIIQNASLKLKDVENQRQLGQSEVQKQNAHIELLNEEISNIKNQFEQLKRQSKIQQQQQDAIVSSFQYKLDEFLKEKQLSLLLCSENNEKNNKSQVIGKSIKSTNNTQNGVNIPDGFQLIEISTVKNFTAMMNEGNKKLQEKCDNFNRIISEYKEKETNLTSQNSKLNSELQSHLKEIVHQKKCIEILQQELSKNSETTFEEMKLELEDKCDAFRKTEDILAKLESSVNEEEIKWRQSINESRQEILRLENELQIKNSQLHNRDKEIIELTKIFPSYNKNNQTEVMINGTYSEISNQ